MVTKFHLEGEYIELVKLLKATGLCESGGMAKNAVIEGGVTVNGVIEFRKRCKIRKGQTVEFNESIIKVD